QSTATEHVRLSDDVGLTEQVKDELPKNASLPSSSEKGGGDDLPEYEALQRSIINYDAERRASVASQAGAPLQSKKWWQFCKSSPAPVQPAHPVIKEGQPPSSWLETNIRQGIASHDIETRRKPFGWNELTAEKENMFAKFLGFFQRPIRYVMEPAALLAVGLGDWVDFGEKQAADVVASLKGDIAMRATVVRDGQKQQILARELDILVEGQKLPGDCQLICDYSRPGDYDEFVQLCNEDRFGDEGAVEEPPGGTTADGGGDENTRKDGEEDFDYEHSHYGLPLIACDQSAITRESLAVDKYMGDISNKIGGFFHHIPVARPGVQTLLHYALVLFIIGVPVGLPVVTTTTLAVGAAYLAKQRAIVQKLTAIESLAGVNVLCSDKTGTLTANKLSIRDPFVIEGQDVNWMMAVAALASSHNVASLDPTDKVTILTLEKYPKARDILRQGWKTDKFTPIDPVSKRITCESRLGNDKFICAKGAPKNVLQLTEAYDETRTAYNTKTKDFARRGFRSLGMAYKKNDEPWVLLGLLSMFDPPREDTAQIIIEAQALGVPVKMLTGDAIAIAKETCKMLGLGVSDAPSLKKADGGTAVEGSSEAAQAAADIVFLDPGLSTIILSIKTGSAERGTMFLRSGGIIARFGSIQEVLFLQVSLTENWLIFVTRGGKTWPSWQFVFTILGVDALPTIFCLFG
ncbi:PMA1-H+-transporting P-type ATPase, partial [Apiospora phragmitis]